MWQLLLMRFTEDPWWVGASGGILAVVLVLFVFSMLRNVRSLFWYYLAAILIGVVYSLYVYWNPVFLEALVAYRSDWSLVYLLNNFSFSSVLSLWVYYLIVYGFLAIIIIVTLGLCALLTFRWRRLKIIIERSLSESWYVLLFSVLTVFFNYLLVLFFDQLSFDMLMSWFEVFAFLFCLQFFLRLLDNAYLHTPKLFLEYAYATGLAFLLFRLLALWYDFGVQNQAFAQDLFFQHLFSFFLVILLLGYLATFFVRALFSSAFFLEHHQDKMSVFYVWTSRLFLIPKDKSYSAQRILLGINISIVMSFVFVLFLLKAWYLVLIPVFFLGFFGLFFLLDRQEDMRVKGDLVNERVESSVREVFFS